MDKLAKIFYNDEKLLYRYKDKVEVPVLEMVDDVLCVAKCGSEAVMSNSTINSFMELNKLKLSSQKCAKIHIGKHDSPCPEYKVHDEILRESKGEKYLGDVISEKGNLDETIRQRKLKGYSYI